VRWLSSKLVRRLASSGKIQQVGIEPIVGSIMITLQYVNFRIFVSRTAAAKDLCKQAPRPICSRAAI
jgi:hypothetical protein